MQDCLFIGGHWGGLSSPDDAESTQMPIGVTGRETYIRETLTLGGVSVVVYRHEDPPPDQVLEQLISHYKSWCANRPGGRR